MILIEVHGLCRPHAVTELRELVTGLSLFGHELTLWFASHALRQQFEDTAWEEVRHLLDTVRLTNAAAETVDAERAPELEQLREQARHLFHFSPVQLTP